MDQPEVRTTNRPKRSRWLRTIAAVFLVLGFFAAIYIGTLPKRYQSPIELQKASRHSRPVQIDDWQESVFAFDDSVRSIAANQQLNVATRSDWLTTCRRISLALVGSGLSLDDIRALEKLQESERVSAYLESCLADSRWSNYWSERFTRSFVGDNDGPFLLYRRRKFRIWLAEQFATNQPYDTIVRKLITANGLWTDRPEVNFYTATADGDEGGRADPVIIAGRTSRIFLAKRIDCLQCHDDFLGNVNLPDANLSEGAETFRNGTQIDFHRLAAFFDGVAVTSLLSGMVDDGREYKAILLGETEPQTIQPQVPFAVDLIKKDLPRQQAFAAWLTHIDNIHFARATVNRIWNLMTGRPLIDPVDDISEKDPMIPALDILSKAFVESGYDLKQLIRAIASTETFRRESRSEDFEVTAAHERFFAAFPVTRLRPEQIALSFFQASTVQRLSDDTNILAQLGRNDQLNNFLRDFGDLGENELGLIPPTVTQRLLLMNGSIVQDATKLDLVANATSKLAQFSANDTAMIEQIYLTFLNRYPTESETQSLLSELHLTGSLEVKVSDADRDPRGKMASDLSHALMNSAEIQWNH